jgi:hypothetical protein
MRAATLKLGSSPGGADRGRAQRAALQHAGVELGHRPLQSPGGRLEQQDGSGRGRRIDRTWGGFTGRVEHALFLVTLGTVGYFWLGAMLVQGA